MNDNHIQWTFQIIFHSISSYAMSLLRHLHLYVNCYFLFWQNRQEIHWWEKKAGVNPVFHFTLQGFANIISQNNIWNNIEQYKCVLFIPSLTWILVLPKSWPQSQNICFCSCLNTHFEKFGNVLTSISTIYLLISSFNFDICKDKMHFAKFIGNLPTKYKSQYLHTQSCNSKEDRIYRETYLWTHIISFT